jgi:hypothetical protein
MIVDLDLRRSNRQVKREGLSNGLFEIAREPRDLRAEAGILAYTLVTNLFVSDSHRISAMEKKIFWIVFTVLGLIADFVLGLWWGLAATIPIVYVSWWVAYRSDWF